MRRLKNIAKILLGLYILSTLMLYFFQEKLIFLPSKLPQDYSYSFALPHEEFNLETSDGAVLNGLHFKNEVPKGVILYFHGNAGDLSRWGEIALYFVEKQYDVVIMDYRTYGKSTGKLSPDVLFSDAQLFYDYTLEHYKENEVTLYGRSLGTGIATQLASKNTPKQLILETPFYSLLDVAQSMFPILPVSLFLKYKLPSFEFIQQVSCPISIFHGTSDSVVPYESGKKLYETLLDANKSFFKIEDGDHNNLISFPEYHEGIKKVLP
jgi:fermentation-respiration switch protein FrsA (DUF1100 family)